MTLNRIAYGYKRRDRDFDGLAITPGKHFIDNNNTAYMERRAMLSACRPDVVVVVLSMGDFGKGAGAKRVKDAILATGAAIEGPDDRVSPLPSKAGRKGVGFTEDQLKWACALWLDPMRSEKSVLERVFSETGIVANRDQMNYICRRKPKKEAAKKGENK